MPQATKKNHFEFNMSFAKAFTEGGKRYVIADVSDTCVDLGDEKMSKAAIEDMCTFLKNGNDTANGNRPVLLLPSHASSFEIGKGTDGSIRKEADGTYVLSATFQLLDEGAHQEADILYKSVDDATCTKQLSVGGMAIGHAYYDETLKKTVKELDHITMLEHVAVTRENRAAVPSTGFLSAMMKSIDFEPVVIEKAALSAKDRTKAATVILENTTSQSYLIQGDKVYLLPIPDGDTNAAKVALSEMYDWHLSAAQKMAVHDRAAEVLGAEHTCWRCDDGGAAYIIYDEAPAQTLLKTETETDSMEKEIQDAINKGIADAVAPLRTELSSQIAGVSSVMKQIAEKNGITVADEAPVLKDDYSNLGDFIAKSIANGVAAAITPMQTKLTEIEKAAKAPLSRTRSAVPAGAAQIVKNAPDAAANVAAELAEEDDGDEAIEKQRGVVAELETKIAEQGDIAKSGYKFTDAESSANSRLVDKFTKEKSALRGMEAGLTV